MSIFNDTNNSINEILEMLKNYRTEGKPNTSSFQEASHSTAIHPDESSFAHTESKMPDEHTAPLVQNYSSARKSQDPQSGLRLHSSLEHMPKRRGEGSSRAEAEAETIFSRLYE
jgi:hypothetical protein